jgi:hypothetical protein
MMLIAASSHEPGVESMPAGHGLLSSKRAWAKHTFGLVKMHPSSRGAASPPMFALAMTVSLSREKPNPSNDDLLSLEGEPRDRDRDRDRDQSSIPIPISTRVPSVGAAGSAYFPVPKRLNDSSLAFAPFAPLR